MNTKPSSRLWRVLVPVASAAAVSFGVAHAIATPATPSPSATSAAATPPAAAPVTPKTDRPPAARALSDAFAATARALRPSVVRIDVEMSGRLHAMAPDAEPQPDGQGTPDGQGAPDGVPPELRRFFHFNFGPQSGPDDGPGDITPPGPGRGTGSGVVVDASGDIVTNSHVVDHASKVTVTLESGEQIPARVIGRDPQTDLAIIRLQHVPAKLVVARIGNSDQLEVGDWVLAIGSPLGLDQTVTAGIVSGKGHVGRHVQMSGDRMRTYISTDAMINPGNSGGPLVNLEGEVVGINTLINTGPGGAYGFAIPINEATRVTKTLLADGRVRYPYIGVHVGDEATLPPAQKQKQTPGAPDKGAFVSQVTEGSPAARAGLQPGDVITSVNGRPVATAGEVVDAISSKAIGDSVSVGVVRDGKRQQVRVAVGELPSPGPEVAVEESGSAGLALQTLTPDLAASLGLPGGTRGAAVTDVTEGGPAARAGLKPGDVVLEIDRKPVASAEDAAAAIRHPQLNGHLVRVAGEHGARFLTLPTG
jgi:serine protease Do